MFRLRSKLSQRAGAMFAGSALLMGGVGLTILAPAATAGVVTPNVHCVLPASQGEGTGPQSIGVQLSATNAAPGDVVQAVVTLGTGPMASTQTFSNVPTTPSVDLAMSGGATGTVTVTGATTEIDVVNGQYVQIPVFTGSFIVPNTAQGTVNFTPSRVVTKTVVLGGTYTTPCTVVSGGGSIGAINVQGPGSAQPSLSSPTGTVRPGYVLPFGGAGWPSSASASATLCPAGGGACILDPFTSTALNISASGVLTGTAALAPTGLPDGQYTVTVTAGGKQASTTVTVQAFVQSGNRVLTMTPSSGPVGTVLTLTGSNWSANTSTTIAGLAADGTVTDDILSIFTSPDGTIAQQYTVASPEVTQIRVREGLSSTKRVILPYTVTTAPPSAQVTSGPVFRNGVATLSGGYWPAGTVSAQLCNAAGTGCTALAAQSLTVAGNGALSGTVTVGSSAPYGAQAIKVTSASGPSALAPITVQRTIKLTKQLGNLYKIQGWDFGDFETVHVSTKAANGTTIRTIDTFTLADGYWLTYLIVDGGATSVYAADTSSTPKTSTYTIS